MPASLLVDLVLFGGFLALGQTPFVFFFVLKVCGGVEGRSRSGYVVAVWSAFSWALAGFVGWTAGSYYEAGFETPLYSNLGGLAGVLPWLFVGVLEGVVLVVDLAAAGGLRNGGRSRLRGSAGTLVASGVSWALVSSIGGLFHEYWASFDIAARQNWIKDAIGAFLREAGVAENVAFEVVPSALVIPVLYAVPTGLILAAIRCSVSR